MGADLGGQRDDGRMDGRESPSCFGVLCLKCQEAVPEVGYRIHLKLEGRARGACRRRHTWGRSTRPT